MTMYSVPVLTTDKHEFCLSDVDITFSAAPVYAYRAIQNGTNGKVTFTSLKNAAIGNTMSVVFTMSTNTASVAVTNYAIAVDVHQDGTNAYSDTTASNVATLINANTNITAFCSIATNTAGIMGTNATALFTNGSDNFTVVSTLGVTSCTLNSIGNYTIELPNNYLSTVSDSVKVIGTSALSNVAKVEIVKVDSNTMTMRFADYAGNLVDPSAACVVRGFIWGAFRGTSIPN